MEVFRQRLEDEYDANIIVTAPTVPYKGTFVLVISNCGTSRVKFDSCL